MGRPAEISVNRFDAGIVNDPRDPRENTSRIITNFDTYTNIFKISPHGDQESGDSAPTTSKKQNFCVSSPDNGSSFNLYALGVKSGTSLPEVLFKDLDKTSTNNLLNNTWGATSANQGANATGFNTFVSYEHFGPVWSIFGVDSSRYIWGYDPTGSGFNSTAVDLTSLTHSAQGLVHSKDNILYIPYDNKIAKKSNGSSLTDQWTTAALTLPSRLIISSLAESANHIAIACVDKAGIGDSHVFIWDRDSSLTTLDESVNWGEGALMVLEEIEGVLIGISQVGGTASSFSGVPNANATLTNNRIIFRYWQRGMSSPKKFLELQSSTDGVTQVPIAKQRVNNRLYFMMRVYLNGAQRDGVWSLARGVDGGFVLTHEHTPNNDTALTSSAILKGFTYAGDYLFISYQDTDFALTKTDDTIPMTQTAIYESKKYDFDAPRQKKKLIGFSVNTEALTSGEQVVVKYKLDDDTAFSSAWMTHSTVGELSKSQVGKDIDEFYEIEFRLESTGGAEITGFTAKAEILDKDTPYG